MERIIWVLESDPQCTYLTPEREAEMRNRILAQIAEAQPIVVLPPGRRLVAVKESQLVQAVKPR